jgi:phage gpG-like protein
VRIIINSKGFGRVDLKFTRLSEAAIDARPAMVEVARLMLEIIRKNFESGGRRGGGSWAQDSTAWTERKIEEGMDPRVGFYTGRLYGSFARLRAKNQIYDVGPHHIVLGSSLPYARAQEKHRPYMKFTQTDRLAMRGIIKEYFKLAWREGGL